MQPTQPPIRTATLSILAMIAFAANSVLCRVALKETDIDAASFTVIRLVSGAIVLAAICFFRDMQAKPTQFGDWPSAFSLFAYAAAFSFAYVSLPTGTGALLLFGAVQLTMIAAGLLSGERLNVPQWTGLAIAISGLVLLLMPGIDSPPLLPAMLMVISGIAWGLYSLQARGKGDPTKVTAGNFLRASIMGITLVPFSLVLGIWDTNGIMLAVISGGIASGLGYVLWYAVLKNLTTVSAASIQLSVPVIAALGGVIFLAEPLTMTLVMASLTILGGIALVIRHRA